MAEWPKVLPDDRALNPMTKTCLLCGQPVGAEHSRECGSIGRKVRLVYAFEVEAIVPYQMTNDQLKAYRNSAEWCAVGAWAEVARASQPTGCPCAVFDCLSVENASPDPVQAPGARSEPVRARYPFRAHRVPSEWELN